MMKQDFDIDLKQRGKATASTLPGILMAAIRELGLHDDCQAEESTAMLLEYPIA